MLDEKLSYISHSKKVNQKLSGSWVNMCEYTNRNYGFNQRVITQITKSYFLSSLHYAGMIWQNTKSIKEIESMWYKIMKSAIGAIFNIRLSLAEVILGLVPLQLQNVINQVKHYLKMNIRPSTEDKLRDFIQGCFSQQYPTPVELTCTMKEVFKFLKWKIKLYPRDFSDTDINIVYSQDYCRYFDISPKSCSYTKQSINKYIESLWYQRLKNEFLAEGMQHVPNSAKAIV